MACYIIPNVILIKESWRTLSQRFISKKSAYIRFKKKIRIESGDKQIRVLLSLYWFHFSSFTRWMHKLLSSYLCPRNSDCGLTSSQCHMNDLGNKQSGSWRLVKFWKTKRTDIESVKKTYMKEKSLDNIGHRMGTWWNQNHRKYG